MRQFIVIGHEAPVESGINLEDLPGSAGRLDLLARCVTSGLLHSHGIRDDTVVRTIHQDEVTVRFDGASMRQLHPDERSTAARFDAALSDVRDAIGHVAVESAPGIEVSRLGLRSTLEAVEGSIVQLHPDGIPITEWDPNENVTCVLSDHHPFSPEEDALLEGHVDRRVRIGPVAVHADQAITVAHNYLDTEGYRTY